MHLSENLRAGMETEWRVFGRRLKKGREVRALWEYIRYENNHILRFSDTLNMQIQLQHIL